MLLALIIGIVASQDNAADMDAQVQACLATVASNRFECIREPFAWCEARTRANQPDLNRCSAAAEAAWGRRLAQEERRVIRALPEGRTRAFARIQARWHDLMVTDCQLRAPAAEASIRPFAHAMCRAEHLALRTIQVAELADTTERLATAPTATTAHITPSHKNSRQ